MAIRHLEQLKGVEYFKNSNLPCLVREMHDAPSNNVVAMHDHDFSELVLIASGSLNHIHSGGTVRLRVGDFFVIHPGERHGYAELAPHTTVFNILFHIGNPPPALVFGGCGLLAYVFPKKTESVKANTLGHVAKRNLPDIVDIIKAIRKEETTVRPLRCEVCMSLFAAVLLLLSREMCDGNSAMENPIQAEIGYIGRNLGRRITLAELGAVSGKSISALSREFRKVVGRSPSDYMLDMRVAKARIFLSQSGATLEKVAAQTGFCSASHLSNTLKKRR